MNRKVVYILSIIGAVNALLAAAVLYFIKRGEELAVSGDRDFFGNKWSDSDNDWK